jgi:hypothetical protein
MILIIRGHIRKSFDNLDLFNFIKDIYSINCNLKIYIHTWNVFSNNISWRKIDIDNKIVTKEIILHYFGVLNHIIEEIIIDDDSKIELIGNCQDTINGGPMPLIGWKNYWYGKYRIIKHLYDKNIDPNEMIINFRSDLFRNELFEEGYFFENDYTKENYRIFLLDFIKKHICDKFTTNIFTVDYESIGIDNIYIGNINTMYKLIHKFHYELDDILMKNDNSIHQEFFVYRENIIINE